jgi:hypothetical protein
VGNSGTTPSTSTIGTAVNNNFIGTTDAKDYVLATNNLERMRITSGGSIGIGTTTPNASEEIYQAANDILKLTSNIGGAGNHVYIDFQTYASTTAVMAKIGAIDMGTFIGSLVFETNNAGVLNGATTNERMRVLNNGYVGIGTSTPGYPLEVEATENAGYGDLAAVQHEYISRTTVGNSTAGSTGTVSIYTGGRVVCLEADAISDRRVKKDFSITNSKDDIERLSKIEVTNFRYRDEIANGRDFKKGFIAQQVETVYPEAVIRHTGFIPDIYTVTDAVNYDPATHSLTISIDADHGLAVGDKVRLIADGTPREVAVSAVHSDCSFTVADWTVPVSRVFVYGKEVSDFRAVDYDRIYTLNVSATQELARQLDEAKCEIEQLEKQNREISDVRSKYEEMSKKNDKLQSDMDQMKASIETMQQILESKAQK